MKELISNARLKLAKKSSKYFSYLKIIHIFYARYNPKIIAAHILKSKPKNKRVFIQEIAQLIIMKIKVKNRSRRYDINRHRSRHEHKYSKYKKCLRIIILYVLTLS